MMRKTQSFMLLALLMAVVMLMSSCAGTINAIDNASMQTTVKMSDSIFLEPDALLKNKTVFIKVTNTSEMQELEFERLLKESLTKKGMKVVDSASAAGWIVQANVLYMNYEREGTVTADGLLAGAVGGAGVGFTLGNDLVSAGIGTVIGGLGGMLLGSAFKVGTFLGAVDIQIREKVEGGVAGTVKTVAKQGSSTTLTTERAVKSDYQLYTTRIVARAKQTNIDKKDAAAILSDKIAIQIAGFFN